LEIQLSSAGIGNGARFDVARYVRELSPAFRAGIKSSKYTYLQSGQTGRSQDATIKCPPGLIKNTDAKSGFRRNLLRARKHTQFDIKFSDDLMFCLLLAQTRIKRVPRPPHGLRKDWLTVRFQADDGTKRTIIRMRERPVSRRPP
jgi:hypothetical protein